jgi:hypothetical protein
MSSTCACDREEDVLEAVMSGRWRPEDSGDPTVPGAPGIDALRGHAAGCPVCRDLAAVAAAFQDERDLAFRAFRDAQVPASGQVWWRATMRTRAEAAATAARPITMVQGLAGTCAAGLCAGLVGHAWPSIEHPLARLAVLLSQEAQRIGSAAVSAAAMQQVVLSVAIILGAGLILTPFILCFVLSAE